MPLSNWVQVAQWLLSLKRGFPTPPPRTARGRRGSMDGSGGRAGVGVARLTRCAAPGLGRGGGGGGGGGTRGGGRGARGGEPERGAEGDQDERIAQDHPDHLSARGAERDAQADFAGAPRGAVGDHRSEERRVGKE